MIVFMLPVELTMLYLIMKKVLSRLFHCVQVVELASRFLKSMALGRPVVSTTIGCEGLDVIDGHHLLIGDSPEQFARSIARLLKDSILYRQISENARKLVVETYDWNVIVGKLLDVYSNIVQEPECQK